LDFLLKRRDLNSIGSISNCQIESSRLWNLCAFSVANWSGSISKSFWNSSPLFGRSLDVKAKMVNDDILFIVGAQSGAKSAAESRDLLDTQLLRGFTRVLLHFLANVRESLDFLLKHRDLNRTR
jgi:hypothetical protein